MTKNFIGGVSLARINLSSYYTVLPLHNTVWLKVWYFVHCLKNIILLRRTRRWPVMWKMQNDSRQQYSTAQQKISGQNRGKQKAKPWLG